MRKFVNFFFFVYKLFKTIYQTKNFIFSLLKLINTIAFDLISFIIYIKKKNLFVQKLINLIKKKANDSRINYKCHQ